MTGSTISGISLPHDHGDGIRGGQTPNYEAETADVLDTALHLREVDDAIIADVDEHLTGLGGTLGGNHEVSHIGVVDAGSVLRLVSCNNDVEHGFSCGVNVEWFELVSVEGEYLVPSGTWGVIGDANGNALVLMESLRVVRSRGSDMPRYRTPIRMFRHRGVWVRGRGVRDYVLVVAPDVTPHEHLRVRWFHPR
jgi:hypothetical protein